MAQEQDKAELRRMLPVFKEQLLLALVRSLGGRVEVPVAEVDANGGQAMTMQIDQERRVFVLEVRSRL